MLDRFGLNPTQLIGVLSFGAATLACAIAAWRSRSSEARMWGVVAFINCLFAIEVVLGLRHRLHAFAYVLMIAEGWYKRRYVPQEIGTGVLAVIFLVGTAYFLMRVAPGSRAARIASAITTAIVGLFAIETMSLHAVDALLYTRHGQIALVGWLWAVGTGGIILAAIWRSTTTAGYR